MSDQHTKKCPACGQWSPWHLQDTDRCTHCGALLDSRTLKEREARVEYERLHREDSFFTPRATDGALMQITRRAAFAAYIAYTAVVAFIMYIITTIVG